MAKKSSEVSDHTTLTIKSYLSPKNQSPETQSKLQELIHQHPSEREYLSTKDFNKAFAVDKKEINEFIEFAEEKSWEVSYDKKTRELQITIANADDFEGSNMHCVRETSKGGDVDLEANKAPHEIKDGVHKKGFVKKNTETRVGKSDAPPRELDEPGLSVLEVAEAYNFPEGDGEGQTIGIIELGGGASKSDLKSFFAHYNVDQPKIQIKGKPTTLPIKDDLEVTCDIEVAGILAPKAKFVIYYGDSILEAMKSALADRRNRLSVISISWAGSEDAYSRAELEELNQVFYEAAAMGITVIAASGDNGAFNNKTYPNVNVPSIFYHVLGCGGTQLEIYNDKISAETVWNESSPGRQVATGGGFSQKVSLPAYQQRAIGLYLGQHQQYEKHDPLKGRGVPDVAANASEFSGYSILFEGKWTKVGGTSLATPLWAALIARINQNLGYNLGYINPQLYQLMGSSAFHPVVQGNNNLYVGAIDWNPCTGLGTPNGKNLQAAIEQLKNN
jgi:subtilase family serine protease